MGFKIGDLLWALRAKGGALLDADLKREGTKGGETFGASLLSSIKKSWSGGEIGKGLVQGLGLAGGLGAAKLLSEGIGAVGDAIGSTIEHAIDFEKAMRNVNSISKMTDKQLADMSDQVLQLAGDFGQSSTTMAEGLYDISSSGFQGAEAMKVLEASTKAATAGLSTTAESSKGIVAVLNAYHKSADQAADVSDVMFQTVNRGVITFAELSDQIGKTTALSAPLGVSLEDVAAAVALMTRNGIGAEETFTQINAVMNSMLKPSSEAADLAEKLGLRWDAAGLKANGLAGQMAQLVDKTHGSHEQMAILLGDSRAIRGAFVLAANGGKDLNGELKIMQHSAGATASAFEEQAKSTAFHIAQMQAKIEAAQIAIGEKLLPIVAQLADFVTANVVPALDDFADALDRVTDSTGDTGQNVDDLGQRFAENSDPIVEFANLLHDLFKSPDEDARTFVGSIFDSLNDLQTGLGDAAAWINDFWTFWDDHSTLADRHTAQFADHTMDNIETMRAQASVDLQATSGALDSTGSHATDMAGEIDAATDSSQTSIEDLRKKAVTEFKAMVDGYFNPIETRYDLQADRAESSSIRQQLAADRSKKAHARAKEAIVRNIDSQISKLEDLADTGDLTATDVDTFRKDVTADYKSLGEKVPPKVQAIITKLNTLWRATNRDYSVPVKVWSTLTGDKDPRAGRASGGPVQSGVAYIVGERRPELFVPEVDGRIIPKIPTIRELTTTEGTKTGDTNITVALPTTARPDPFETARQLRRLADLKLLTPTEKYG